MYQAFGRQVRRNADTTFTVKVEIVDDRTTKTVRHQTYTARTKPELQALIVADLKQLVDAETDATLSAAIVDVVLAQI